MIKWESLKGHAWVVHDGTYAGRVARHGPWSTCEGGPRRHRLMGWTTEVRNEPGPFFRRRVDAKRYIECELARTTARPVPTPWERRNIGTVVV